MNPLPSTSRAYGTVSELSFICLLGGCGAKQAAKKTRVDLLDGYITGLEKRTNWKGIARAHVLEYAREQLQLEIIIQRNLAAIREQRRAAGGVR